MFKKIMAAVMLIATVFTASNAGAVKIGSKIDNVYHTDIVAYINNYAIPSYAANGTSVIVAEDLRNFGFDVVWDSYARTLSITRNTIVNPSPMDVRKTGKPGSKMTDMLYTDIKVYANGIQIPSYAINGYTMIPIESLTMLGTCNWVPEQRAIKLWVDGLNIRNTMQSVEQYSGDLTGVWVNPDYPDNYSVIVYAQQGNRISMFIEAVKGYGSALAQANVENVEVKDGKAVFRFTDSFGYTGTGTMIFSGDTMTVSYSNLQGNQWWSIEAGGNMTYKKTKNMSEIDFSWFDRNDYNF